MNCILAPTLALLLSTSAVAHPVASQSEEGVLATYDLRRVMPRWDGGSSWSHSLLLPPVSSEKAGDGSIRDSLQYGDIAAYELLDLLTQILGDELRREGREVMVEDHVLTVLAPTSLHEQVRSILEGLEMALAGTVPVRIDILTLPEVGALLPPAGLLDEVDAERLVSSLVDGGSQHQNYVLELSAGRSACLDAFRRIPFLFDYDVEIAQNIMIFQPIMAETRDGAQIVLRGLSVPGGLALSSVLMRSELLGPIETKPLSLGGLVNHTEKDIREVLNGPNARQSPEILLRAFAFDTFLPDGKALCMTLASSLGKAKLREVVVFRRLGGAMSSYVTRPIPGTNRTLIAMNAELFRAPRLSCTALPRMDEWGVAQPNLVTSFDGELSGFLLEWMKARFSVWRRFGPWILIVTDPAWDRDAPAQLDKLVKGLRQVMTLNTASIDLHAQGSDPAFPIRLKVPILAGSSAGFAVARGQTALTGFDVEVAGGSAAPDPHVSSVFEGFALALSIDDRTCEISGIAQLYDSPISAIDPGYDILDPIERPEPRTLRFDDRLRMPEGQSGPVRIGGGSDRPDQPGLTLEITASRTQR